MDMYRWKLHFKWVWPDEDEWDGDVDEVMDLDIDVDRLDLTAFVVLPKMPAAGDRFTLFDPDQDQESGNAPRSEFFFDNHYLMDVDGKPSPFMVLENGTFTHFDVTLSARPFHLIKEWHDCEWWKQIDIEIPESILQRVQKLSEQVDDFKKANARPTYWHRPYLNQMRLMASDKDGPCS